jgi:glyoxylase-like metal-dependent hydrolase (beta-lactamase superfamily II)
MKLPSKTCDVFVTTVLMLVAVFLVLPPSLRAQDNGEAVDPSRYANRRVLPDLTAAPCPDNPRSRVPISRNLYRHTTGAGLAVHSGLVLITKEGALVIDPAMTCTAGWLRDEINSRFHVKVKYVVHTHAHANHISGAQIFQQDGAMVIANPRPRANCRGTNSDRFAKPSVRQRHDHHAGRGNGVAAPRGC